MQTLKEAFAAKIPGEIERIKRLRKLVHFLSSGLLLSNVDVFSHTGNMVPESWMKSPSIRFMEELVASSHWSGRFVATSPFSIPVSGRGFCFIKTHKTKHLGIRFRCRRGHSISRKDCTKSFIMMMLKKTYKLKIMCRLLNVKAYSQKPPAAVNPFPKVSRTLSPLVMSQGGAMRRMGEKFAKGV